jgi:hypothetical protein
MAKKQTKAYAGDPGDEHVEKIAPVMETPKPTRVEPKSQKTNDGWKIQDRTYLLTDGSKPLSKSIKSAGIYHFDENLGYEREMRLSHIVFRAGVLFVPKNKVTLQKLLALHPYNGKVFYELKPQKIAEFEVESIEIEIEALNAAQALDIDMAEAVMRVELGSRVTKMSSKELKRDLLLYAKRNPSLFLELINDENVHLRNIGIRATEMGLLKLSQDQRTFSWKDTNRKLMNVPFDEHPYSALAAWFKTDEGMEIFTNIEKRLK